MRGLLIIALGACLALGAACLATPVAAQPVCGDPPLVQAPDRVTSFQRDGFSAYRNDAVPADQPFEMHLVGSYEGSGRVTIAPSEKPIVLVLGAYSEGIWHVELQAGARLARVILLGQKPQRLKGVPASVEIVDRTGCGESAYAWEGSQNNVRYMRDEFRRFLASAQQASGMVESSFQGAYNLAAPFTIPLVASSYRVADRIEQPAEARDIVKLSPDEVLADYDKAMADAPPPFRPTMKILIDLMKHGKLPVLFPNGDPSRDPRAPKGLRRLFEPGRISAGSQRCGRYVLGRPEGETLDCAWGNQFYVLGNGDDVLKDSWGDDIVNPGGGDDIINVGWGNDIVVLEAGWGNDLVTKTCSAATLTDADRTRLGWQHRYTNFIVFGPGISPGDIRWESKTVLTHAPSKSRLTIKGDCFNLVFTEQGDLQAFTPPAPPPPPQPVAAPSPAEQEAARQQAREKIVQSLSAAPQGDVIVEVDPATFAAFDQQASIQPRDGVARLVRRDGKLMLVFFTKGSRGIIEIRPKTP